MDRLHKSTWNYIRKKGIPDEKISKKLRKENSPKDYQSQFLVLELI